MPRPLQLGPSSRSRILGPARRMHVAAVVGAALAGLATQTPRALVDVAGHTLQALRQPLSADAATQAVSIARGRKAGCTQTGHRSTAYCYVPPAVTAVSGDVVTWSNATSTVHTVTRCSAAACPGGAGTGRPGDAFDSGRLASSARWSHTFTGAGTYTYYCAVHGYAVMHGTVTVSPGPSSTPAPRPTPVATPPPAAPPAAPSPGAVAPASPLAATVVHGDVAPPVRPRTPAFGVAGVRVVDSTTPAQPRRGGDGTAAPPAGAPPWPPEVAGTAGAAGDTVLTLPPWFLLTIPLLWLAVLVRRRRVATGASGSA